MSGSWMDEASLKEALRKMISAEIELLTRPGETDGPGVAAVIAHVRINGIRRRSVMCHISATGTEEWFDMVPLPPDPRA